MSEGLAFEPEDAGRDPVLTDLGERMRFARLRANLTQEDLGDKLGVTQTAVSYWEGGKRDPGVSDLLRIAEACGVPASSLLPPEHREQGGTDGAEGRWACIAFMGRNEYTGYVRDITRGGQPAYRVDLPGLVYGGNPLDYVEYAASAWFSEWPVTEESIRAAWESKLRAAERRRQQEAEWDRAQRQRAIAAGGDFGHELGEGDYDDEDDDDD